uniref:RHS repeat-associated core domain-containing protein n=1 Tax=Burkholderia gladioli TaxID=28095 RepID=UPI001FC86F6F
EVIERASAASGGAVARNALRFQGQQVDDETGLHYNRHRYYDPVSGRFTSRDPIKLAGGSNIYQYAPNSVEWVDPLGLWPGQPRNKNELPSVFRLPTVSSYAAASLVC